MNRVFIVNYGGHDISDAYRFVANGDADMVYVTTGNVNVFNTDRVLAEMKFNLKSFQEEDFLLLCGYAILGALALSHLLSRFDLVKILLWNAKSREYTVRHISKEAIAIVDEAIQDSEG